MDAFEIDGTENQDIEIPGSGHEFARSKRSVGTHMLPKKLLEGCPSYLSDLHRQIQKIRKLVQFGRLIEAWLDISGLLRRARLCGCMFPCLGNFGTS